MPQASGSRHCRVCGSPEAEPFFRLSGVPVQDGRLWASEAEACAAPSGDIELVFCEDCGYVGNRVFDPGLLLYDPTYDISLHHSPLYSRFIEDLVDRLARDHALAGKQVLEIGCGKGDFLAALCERGKCRGLGFDPTSPPRDEGAFRVVADFYSERFASEPADLVCCRHVLNSIGDLRGFLGTLHKALGKRTESALYFEVPDGSLVLRRRVVWNVVYEHCSFFTEDSLERLMSLAGFRVRRTIRCFRDEYLGLEASPSLDAATSSRVVPGAPGPLSADVSAFAAVYRDRVARWADWLEGLRRSGRRAVLWGAGARAVAFLSALRPGEEISHLVDINPRRQGLYMPVTAQRVAEPGSLLDEPADAILITNPVFADEIRQQVDRLGVRSEILVLD